MRRCAAHRTLPLTTILLLLPLAQPAALAQGAPPKAPEAAPPSAQEPGPDEAVLSLEGCLKSALENNLNIAVHRYDSLKSGTQVTLQQALFDPLLTGSAASSQDQQTRHQQNFNPLTLQDEEFTFPQTSKLHTYAVGFLDPLLTGGNYRVDLAASDDVFVGTALDTSTFTTFPFQSTQYQATWKVSFTQPLWRNFGTNTNRWLIVTARNSLGISASQFRQTVIDTLSTAEKAYWDLNFTLMDLKTKRGSLKLAEDFLAQNRIKVRVGTLAPIEITQAEAGVADREQAVIIAESAVRAAEDALRQIMNVPGDSPMWSQSIRPLDAPPLVEVTPDLGEAVTAADTNRPDLEQARLGLKSRETELAYRKNQRRWGLDFQGNYGRSGVSGILTDTGYPGSVHNLRDDYQESWSAMLTLGIPIGNRQAVANYTNAEYALAQARYDMQRLEQAALLDVRGAVRAVQTNLKRVKAAQVNSRLQREKLDAEQKKFENGMSTSFQVLTFQSDLATAETGENQAMVDYNKSLADLERAKGTLLKTRNIVVPGETGGADGAAEGPSAALRGLWSHAPAPQRGEAFAADRLSDPEPVTLPTRFVFQGRRLVPADGLADAQAPGSR